MSSSPLLLLLFLLLAHVGAFDPESYENSIFLNEDFQVYWTVDSSKNTVSLALNVETTGWIGFGIGEVTSGSMPGADMVVIEYDENGKIQISDRFATDFVTPEVDACQNWILVSSMQNGDGTVVELKRDLVTDDTQDQPIVAGGTRVVYAYGTSTQKTLSYHQTRRGMGEIVFFPIPGSEENYPSDPDAKVYEGRMGNVALPAQKTTYICNAIRVPLLPTDADHHIIQVEAVLDPVSSKYCHHMLVHICTNNTADSYVNEFFENPGECFSPVGDVSRGCKSLLYAWAVGMGPLKLPKAAGYRMGYSAAAFEFVVVEMHYDNPSLVAGVTDDSGFKIHYTPNLREFDAGTLTVGDSLVSFDPIPAGESDAKYEASCPSECSQKFPGTLNVFASFLHMHMTGKMMWTTQYRNNELISTSNRVEYYSFDAQQQTMVNFTIEQGDRLNVHCIYDTTSRTEVTRFGIASEDEMCMDFLSYYPRMEFGTSDFAHCGYIQLQNKEVTLCGSSEGISDFSSIMLTVPNPVDSDMSEGDFRTFGVAPTSCKNTKDMTPIYIGVGVAIGVFLIAGVVGGVYFVKRKRTGYQTIDDTKSMMER